jgi:hypothetical protein
VDLSKLIENQRIEIEQKLTSDFEGPLSYEDYFEKHGREEDAAMLELVGNYADLLVNNIDHFGPNALRAYMAGHREALKLAELCQGVTDIKQKNERLRRAYLYDAFAMHYYTDLHSAGHIRTPRRELFHFNDDGWFGFTAKAGSYFGGYLSFKMHEDDNHNGLWVTTRGNVEYEEVIGNKTVQKVGKRTPWLLLGDDHLLEAEQKQTFDNVREGALKSLEEVWEVANGTKKAADFADEGDFIAINYLPEVITNKKLLKNPKMMHLEPLVSIAKGVVSVRGYPFKVSNTADMMALGLWLGGLSDLSDLLKAKGGSQKNLNNTKWKTKTLDVMRLDFEKARRDREEARKKAEANWKAKPENAGKPDPEWFYNLNVIH